jgi:hypothetical protein
MIHKKNCLTSSWPCSEDSILLIIYRCKIYPYHLTGNQLFQSNQKFNDANARASDYLQTYGKTCKQHHIGKGMVKTSFNTNIKIEVFRHTIDQPPDKINGMGI